MQAKRKGKRSLGKKEVKAGILTRRSEIHPWKADNAPAHVGCSNPLVHHQYLANEPTCQEP